MNNEDNPVTILEPAMPRYNSWLTDEAIKKVEEIRSCKFVGEFPVREHSTVVGGLFYQEKPPQSDYSNYFFLYRNYTGMKDHPDNGKLFITSGSHMDHRILSGIRTKHGHFIYSRGRHDYIEFDGSMVDGGDSYMRCWADANVVKYQIIEDKMIELTNVADEPQQEKSEESA